MEVGKVKNPASAYSFAFVIKEHKVEYKFAGIGRTTYAQVVTEKNKKSTDAQKIVYSSSNTNTAKVSEVHTEVSNLAQRVTALEVVRTGNASIPSLPAKPAPKKETKTQPSTESTVVLVTLLISK